MSSCTAFFLECLAGALAGIGIIFLCWRMRRPLQLAQHYDRRIVAEQQLYGALPIYGYLRRYFVVLLLAGCVVLLVSVASAVAVILDILDSSTATCPADGVATSVFRVLVLFMGIHMPMIAAFETAKHLHGPYPITALVENVRLRLWGVAVFLLLAIGLVALFGFAL